MLGFVTISFGPNAFLSHFLLQLMMSLVLFTNYLRQISSRVDFSEALLKFSYFYRSLIALFALR